MYHILRVKCAPEIKCAHDDSTKQNRGRGHLMRSCAADHGQLLTGQCHWQAAEQKAALEACCRTVCCRAEAAAALLKPSSSL